MNKAERLLDLVAFLLNAREPVSFGELRNAFPEDYGEGSDEAAARKFERDKADLLQLGVPLKYQDADEFDQAGYFIDRKSYSLPPIPLGPEELALLFMAGSAALDLESSPFTQDLLLALNKIGFASGDPKAGGWVFPRGVPPGRSSDSATLRQKEHLEMLHRAIVDRKSVTLSYHGFWRDQDTKRKVDPYGLVNRSGTWILVGYCHMRQGVRVFHVDRIRGLAVNPIKPKTPDFSYPSDFKLGDYVAREPWQIKAHEPVRAKIRFEPPVAATVVTELGASAATVEQDGEARIVTVEATFLDGLLPTVLWYRDRAQVLEPPELVAMVKEAWQRLGGAGA